MHMAHCGTTPTDHVHALSYAQVDAIRAGLNRLSPYRRDAVPELLKLEPENGPPAGHPGAGPLHAVALSAKRYALYNPSPAGPVIRKASNHGLGLYRRPFADLEPDVGQEGRAWPAWAEEVWQRVIAEAEGRDPAPEPDWFGLPAVSQIHVSSPHVLRPFAALNAGKSYADQVKPFNFGLLAHRDPLCALPTELEGREVTPVAPYTGEPSEYLGLPWANRVDGRPLRVTTGRPRSGEVRVTTYGDVVADYRLHPEHKSGDPRGGPGVRGSVGVLPRLHVVATEVRHIGKESNRLEEVENGELSAADEVYTEYRDPSAEWEHEVLPRLREMGAARVAELTGTPERTVRSWLREGRVPREPVRGRLADLARTHAAPTAS